jgi:heme-degrading monooxygenase HmoA
MSEISVINTITVPADMEAEAESVRADYVAYFSQQQGFVSSTFYRSLNPEHDGSIKYINIVVWSSYADFERVVNKGFQNAEGVNQDGRRVLGKGFPEPISVSPGSYSIIQKDT